MPGYSEPPTEYKNLRSQTPWPVASEQELNTRAMAGVAENHRRALETLARLHALRQIGALGLPPVSSVPPPGPMQGPAMVPPTGGSSLYYPGTQRRIGMPDPARDNRASIYDMANTLWQGGQPYPQAIDSAEQYTQNMAPAFLSQIQHYQRQKAYGQ